MKKSLLAVVLALTMILLLAAPASAATYNRNLLAGRQGVDVGNVAINTDTNQITVTTDGGWEIILVQARIAGSKSGIPHNKNWNPRPSQFADSASYGYETATPHTPGDGVTSEAFSLSGPSGSGDYLAVHVVVAIYDSGISDWVFEGAWAAGTQFNSGKNFAQYYVVSDF